MAGATTNTTPNLGQLTQLLGSLQNTAAGLGLPTTGGGATAAAPGGQTAAANGAAPDPAAILGNSFKSTLFQAVDGEKINVSLDNTGGLATGLANLSRLFAGRQERVNRLSKALAYDANVNGQLNGVDVQKLSTETETMRQMSDLQKKIFDAVTQSIQSWLR